MYDFAYHEPKTVMEAVEMIGVTHNGRLIAGGMSLIPEMKHRLVKPLDIVDLRLLPELKGIRREADAVVVGAMTRHADVAASEIVRHTIPALARLVGEMADPSVRNRATIGGSIAEGDPAADYAPALLALDAAIITTSRKIAAADFFTGAFATALGHGEIIIAVSFPIPERAAYIKFANTASRYAIVGVFVAKHGADVRVAVTGARACVFRFGEMERALAASFTADAIKGIVIKPDGLNSDIHGTPEDRAHLIGVMAQRAVALAATQK